MIREKHPEAQLIVCADDDAGTPGNPGRFQGARCRPRSHGLLALPLFGADRPTDATDFNDLNQTRGIESVRDSISAATVVGGGDAGSGSAGVVPSGFTEWPEPEPLTEPLEALPYRGSQHFEPPQSSVNWGFLVFADSYLDALLSG